MYVMDSPALRAAQTSQHWHGTDNWTDTETTGHGENIMSPLQALHVEV